MRWVSHPSYRGLERRERRRWRLIERRGADYSGPTPALITALRQLHIASTDLGTPARVDKFIVQIESVAMLALAMRRHRAAQLLNELAARLKLDGADRLDAIPAALQSARLLVAESHAS